MQCHLHSWRHDWRLESTPQLFVLLHVCMRRLRTQAHLFAPFHYLFVPTTAMATGPSSVGATPRAVETTDSSDQVLLPAPSYNENNYHFNHTTPNTTPYYHPSAIMEQLHITEYQTTQTPLLHNNTHYVQLFTAFTLESTDYFHFNNRRRLDILTSHGHYCASEVI